LTPEGKLSPGLAHAQVLLSLPGVLQVAMAALQAEQAERNERLKVSHQRSGPPRSPPPRQVAPVPPPAPPTKPAPALDNDDNPFGPTPPSLARQGAQGDAEGEWVVTSDPLTDEERREIEALEEQSRGDSRPMAEGTTASAATEPPPDDTLSRAYRELGREPSTENASEATPAETIADDALSEPQF